MTSKLQRKQAAPCFPDTIPDCACPFEHWHVGPTNICLDIHFEEDGSVHFLMDAGDWDNEHTAHGLQNMDEAREAAFAWAEKLLDRIERGHSIIQPRELAALIESRQRI